MGSEEKTGRTRSRLARILLLLALVAGLYFRLFGLSHDLDAGFVYHPDTPKQIAAVERYLDGVYYKHFGLSDYDGYPLFNSHLVEYVVRIGAPVVNAVASLLGVPHTHDDPGRIALYWVTRLWNVFLSTLLIYVIYRMGRENFCLGAGVLAAWFLALSPVDMTAAHYETGDTCAGFFATVCMYYAMRIYNRGLAVDYMLAAVTGMFAFAAKYNAGIALVAPVAAHVLRQRRWFDVLESEQIARVMLFAFAAVAGLFLAVPSLFTHPVETAREIGQFFQHVSSGRRLPGEIKEGGILARFAFSMARNGPVLLTILTPCLSAVCLFGLGYILRWNRRMVILYTLPVVYFLLGVSLRPLAHPVYHTMMTPTLFAICAAVLMQAFTVTGRWRRPARVGTILVIGCSMVGLGNESAEEAFYYWHRDTRRMAQAWTRENVPASFAKLPSPYGFEAEEYGSGAGPGGVLFVWSSIRSRDPFPQMQLLKSFDIEEDPLPFFRNPDLEVHAWSPALRAGFRMPAAQRMPSRHGNEVIFPGGAEFWRSDTLFHAKEATVLRRIAVFTQALERASMVIQNGALPNLVDVMFAGHAETIALQAGESRVVVVARPKPSFPCEPGSHFYRVKVLSHFGQARVWLAPTDEVLAQALFAAGRFGEAYPLLAAGARSTGHPTLAAYAVIAATIAGVTPAKEDADALRDLTRIFDEPWTPDRVFDVFGVHPDYLSALDFVAKQAEDMPSAGFDRVEDHLAEDTYALAVTNAPAQAAVMGIPGLLLDAGAYLVSTRMRPPTNAPVMADVDLILGGGADVAIEGDPRLILGRAEGGGRLGDGCAYETVAVPVQVPFAAGELSIAARISAGVPVTVDAVRIRPDVVASLDVLGRVLKVIDGRMPPDQARDALAYAPLLAMGDRRAAEQDFTGAFVCYAAAAQIAPDRVAPLAKAEAIRSQLLPGPLDAARELTRLYRRTRDGREWKEVDVLFADGVRLIGYRLNERAFRRGESFGLNLYWSLEKPGIPVEELAVWVHVKNSDGDLLLQADRKLADDLAMNPGMDELQPHYIHVDVPRKCRLGEYRIEVGVYQPDTGKRVKVKQTELETRGTGVWLPEGIRVVL
jgi:hypothetical protein